MKLLVFYDLPTYTKLNRSQATKFRNQLLKLGYVQVQESIYIKHCFNHACVKTNKALIYELSPPGDVRFIAITNKQYLEDLIIIRGKKSFREVMDNDEDLVIV